MSESVWLQGQPRSGEAPLDEAGLVLDLLQAVPDDLDQMGEAGDGEVGQDAAVEPRPDPSHGVEVGGVGGQLEHPQPWLRAGEVAQGRAGVHIEVVPGQHDVAAGQLAVGGDEDVPVLDPGEGLRLALAPAVAVQPVNEPAAVAGPVAGQPGHRYPPGAAPADADDRGDPAPPPGPRPRRPHRLAAFLFEAHPPPARPRLARRSPPRAAGSPAGPHAPPAPPARHPAAPRRPPLMAPAARTCPRPPAGPAPGAFGPRRLTRHLANTAYTLHAASSRTRQPRGHHQLKIFKLRPRHHPLAQRNQWSQPPALPQRLPSLPT